KSASKSPFKSSTRIECRRGTSGLGHNLALHVMAISESTIDLVTQEPLYRGEEVEVLLSDISLAKPIRRVGRVKTFAFYDSPKQRADSTLGVGEAAVIAFDKPLHFADIQRLSQPQT